jgi:hypothetical protein
MFFSKLWLRIKGELITLRQDLLNEGEIRQKALNLLEKMENSLRESGAEISRTSDAEKKLEEIAGKLEEYSAHEQLSGGGRYLGDREPPAARELEEAWNDLKRSRQDNSSSDSAGRDISPNPRKLG